MSSIYLLSAIITTMAEIMIIYSDVNQIKIKITTIMSSLTIITNYITEKMVVQLIVIIGFLKVCLGDCIFFIQIFLFIGVTFMHCLSLFVFAEWYEW